MKRARTLSPSLTDVLYFGRMIMENDPFKERAPAAEDRAFRAMFGCAPIVVLSVWNKLNAQDVVPAGGEMKHLLWALMYAKQYCTWQTMMKLTKSDVKTQRKWIYEFFDAIALLESTIIKWENRYKGDRLNDCLVSVDGTDFAVPFMGRKFHSHKYKFGSALRYEVAVCILSGDLVWINGPFEPGIWNDLAIFRNALMSELDDGERVEADDGYRGEAPKYVKCPASIGNHEETEHSSAFVRRRQETINKRFKQWGILKNVFRGDLSKHGIVFRVCAIITQIAIENGEPLFQVEYNDPDFDNLYLNDNDSTNNFGDDDIET